MPKCKFCESENVQFRGYNESHKKRIIHCNDCLRWFRVFVEDDDNDITDEELLISNVTLAKQNQRFRDSNRIERKSFREYARVENAIAEYSKEIVGLLSTYDLSKIVIKHEDLDSKYGGLVQISDAHLNELINICGNVYDFNVASKRLKKLAIKAKMYFKSFNIKSILLAFSGDSLNNDNILDKLLNQATNRASAVLLAFYLFEQFILDLNEEFNISIATVSGNEGRIDIHRGFSDYVASNNYDMTLENFLRVAFRNSSIAFIDGDYMEKVVNIAGQNILMFHGDNIGRNDTQKEIQSKIGSYAIKGIMINYVIYGHLHSPHITSFSSRSGSLSGSNDYNEKRLNLMGRASQNLYIFGTNGDREAIMVDLQDTTNIVGYDIVDKLEMYNAKSEDKARDKNIVFQVVV